jgi:hypothetical protein
MVYDMWLLQDTPQVEREFKGAWKCGKRRRWRAKLTNGMHCIVTADGYPSNRRGSSERLQFANHQK